MKISDFFFLLKKESVQSIKFGMLIFLQITFVFLSGTFLFIAQNALENGVNTYISSKCGEGRYIELNIQGSYSYLEEFRQMDAAYVLPKSNGGEVFFGENEFCFFTYSLKDSKGYPTSDYDKNCKYDSSTDIFVNKRAAEEFGLKIGDNLRFAFPGNEEVLKITGIFDDEDSMPMAFISYENFLSKSSGVSNEFVFGFENIQQLNKVKRQLSRDGFSAQFYLDDLLKNINLVRALIFGLFAIIVVIGLNSFRNMCNVFIDKRKDFFVRGKMCGIKTRSLILTYPIIFQILLIVSVIVCIPFTQLFIEITNFAVKKIIQVKVASDFSFFNYGGIVIVFAVGSIVLWLTWYFFGKKINKGSLSEMIDVKQ